MKLTIYDKFNLIPNNKKIIDSIPIFATQDYANYLRETKNCKIIWFYGKGNDDSKYISSFQIVKKGLFSKGIFLTGVIPIGHHNLINYEKDFLNEIIKYIKENSLVDWIQQSRNWAIFNSYPDGAIYAPFGTYRIKLEGKTEEQLFKDIRRKDRQDINKAIREKIIIKKDEECFNDSVNLIQTTLNKAKLSLFTRKKFDIIYKYFKNNIIIYTAYFNNIPQSSVIFLYTSFSTYAIYAGSRKHPARGSTSILFWEAIKRSKEQKIKYFDFVGARINPDRDSKQYRIQKFKSHFGSEFKEGFLWKMVINNKKHAIFVIYNKTLNLLKGIKGKGDIIDQEIKRLKLH